MQRTSSPMTEMVFAMLCCLPSANISAGDLTTAVLACHCLWTGTVPTSQTAASMRSQDTMYQGLCMCQGQVSQPEMSKQLFFPSGGAFVSMVKKMYYHKCCLWAQSWIKTKQTLNPAKFQHSPLLILWQLFSSKNQSASKKRELNTDQHTPCFQTLHDNCLESDTWSLFYWGLVSSLVPLLAKLGLHFLWARVS